MTRKKYTVYKSDLFKNQLREAADYYAQAASLDVAKNFMRTVEKGIDRVSCLHGRIYTPPTGFPELEKLGYRQFLLNSLSSFPYTIYYRLEGDKVLIKSIYGHKQDREAHLLKETK